MAFFTAEKGEVLEVSFPLLRTRNGGRMRKILLAPILPLLFMGLVMWGLFLWLALPKNFDEVDW